MQHSFACVAFVAAVVACVVHGHPMSSSPSKLDPRYMLGPWPTHQISSDAGLFLNLVQLFFRGIWNKVLPPVINAKDCTPIPLGTCCPSGWTQIGSSCYTVLPPQTLSAARQSCAVINGRGHLLAINSYEENTALQGFLKNETCDATGCLVGWSAQYSPPHSQYGNSEYVTYEVPCAGPGLVKVDVENSANLPCNIVYAGQDDISKSVLDKITCSGANTSAMIVVCELELDGDASHYNPDYAICVASSSSSSSGSSK